MLSPRSLVLCACRAQGSIGAPNMARAFCGLHHPVNTANKKNTKNKREQKTSSTHVKSPPTTFLHVMLSPRSLVLCACRAQASTPQIWQVKGSRVRFEACAVLSIRHFHAFWAFGRVGFVRVFQGDLSFGCCNWCAGLSPVRMPLVKCSAFVLFG